MATIRDVAKRARVSVATVSRVLNGAAVVREGTRRRVLKAMKECGYTYNAIAGSLSTRKSVTLGVIVPAITNPIFAQSTRGIQEVANARGYSILLGNSDYSYKSEEHLIEIFKEKRVEGIIFTCSNINHPYIKRLKESNFPFVLLYNTVFDAGLNFVSIDNRQAAYDITRYLVELGHRRIGMIAGSFRLSDRSVARWRGFRDCLRDFKVPYSPQYLIETQLTFEGGRGAMRALLKVRPPLTAIFCSNDLIAMGAMKALREKHYEIPGDLSVCGFDDIEMASYFDPGLTTINQPAYQMGLKAGGLMMDLLSEKVKEPQQVLLKYQLVIRNSCRSVPGPKR